MVIAVSLPRPSSQTSLMEEERTLIWTSQIEERDKTIADMKKKIEELAKQASEARALRDELDILREKALLSSGLEEKLKKAQQKSEQVTDLRKQLKVLEDQNDLYLRQALDAGTLCVFLFIIFYLYLFICILHCNRGKCPFCQFFENTFGNIQTTSTC